MEDIHIKGSKDAYFVPTVDFSVDGVCAIKGESHLEDTVSFFKPLFEWLETYCHNTSRQLKFESHLIYFDTATSRCILDILYIIKDFEDDGGDVDIKWYYDPEDPDMLEEVEDFKIDSQLDIEIIPQQFN